MTKETRKLTAYTLKLSKRDRLSMKLICALDDDFKYQYIFFDKAVEWASNNKKDLMAIANPKEGSNKTYYLSDSVEWLTGLEEEWNCNTTRALYTSVIQFLRLREKEVKEGDVCNLQRANVF